jgi:hypothetical protein
VPIVRWDRYSRGPQARGGRLLRPGVRARRRLFTGLAREAGAPDREGLARQLHLPYDGAGLSARIDHDPPAAVATRAAATVLLDAALGTATPAA